MSAGGQVQEEEGEQKKEGSPSGEGGQESMMPTD